MYGEEMIYMFKRRETRNCQMANEKLSNGSQNSEQ